MQREKGFLDAVFEIRDLVEQLHAEKKDGG
jgi:hypothetical protein